MVKRNTILSITLLFFLILNTTYYWEHMLGPWAMLEAIVLFLTFIGLLITLLYQIAIALKEKLKIKHRLLLIGIMTVVLVTAFAKPRGIIVFEAFEAKDILIAQRPGVAGCST